MEIVKIKLEGLENLEIDFGGDLDGYCCGYLSRQIKKELEELGVILSPATVFCRLNLKEASEAKDRGDCIQSKGGLR